MKQFDTDIIICSCHSVDHQIVFHKDSSYPEVFMEVHLVKRSFWARLKYAIKYVLGYTSRYGAWDEFILTDEHTETLTKIIEHVNDENLKTISFH